MKFLVLASLIATCSAASINVGLRGGYVAGIGGNIGSGYFTGIGGTGHSGLPTGYSGQLNQNPVLEPIVAAVRAGHISSHGNDIAAAAAAAPITVAAPLVAPAPSVVYSSAGLATENSGPINQNILLNGFSNGAAIAAPAPINVAAPLVAAAQAVVAAPVVYSDALNPNTQLTRFTNGAVAPVDEPAVAAAHNDHIKKKGVNAAAAPAAYAASGALNLNTELTGFPNGAVVPLDEPAVAAALADHLAKKGVNVDAAPASYAAPGVYSGRLNLNTQLTSFPNGAVVPVAEPAVALARADHLAKKRVNAAASSVAYAAPGVYSGALNLNTELTSFPNGAVVPVDEPAVAAARADHLAKKGSNADAAPATYAAPSVYSGALNFNTELTSFPNGAIVPVDEPAVAAARTDHLAKKGVNAAATASAPASYAAPGVFSGAINLNTELKSFPNGAVVPVDEPAVAAARADHLAKKGVNAAAAPGVYSGALNLNTELTSFPNGAVVPVEEPAVAAARADHLAKKGVIAAAAPAAYAVAGYAPYAGLVGHPNGAVVPVDEPAVAAARSDHLAKKAGSAAPAPAAYAAGYVYSGPLNLNTELTSFPNGAVVPVYEPAVAAARADHLATKGVYGGVYAAATPAASAAGYAPYAGLVTHPNGAVVPADEPAVAAARADHLEKKGVNVAASPAIYAAGYTPYARLVAHSNGAVVPVDEPAVAAARADHLAKKGVNVAASASGYAPGYAPYA